RLRCVAILYSVFCIPGPPPFPLLPSRPPSPVHRLLSSVFCLLYSQAEMRVAIDARKLHDFGIGTYIRNLLRHLARLDRDSESVLLCVDADLAVASQLGDNFRAVPEPSPNYSIRE